jgi:hypothetical protein
MVRVESALNWVQYPATFTKPGNAILYVAFVRDAIRKVVSGFEPAADIGFGEGKPGIGIETYDFGLIIKDQLSTIFKTT